MPDQRNEGDSPHNSPAFCTKLPWPALRLALLGAVGAVLLWGWWSLAAGPPAAAAMSPPVLDETIGVGDPTLRPRYPVFLTRSPVLHTTIPVRPRLSIVTYTVEAGDTVFGIADAFGISPETVLWANGDLEYHPDDLQIGQALTILPVSGVYHKVEAGDTVESIAKKYSARPADIANYALNAISADRKLTPGQMLIVPGGTKPYVPRYVSHYAGPIPEGASRGGGAFGWPASGYITQRYWSLHRALDIGGPLGSPIYASDSGYVVFAGWDNSGYGNLIIIDHGNGYVTYYAHLSKILVAFGKSVSKGQMIGLMGSTGRSTGSHLHFEIRYQGVQRNPAGMLR